MRHQVSVPGYLDEAIRLDSHDGAITLFQVHEVMGDSTDSIYLEPEQIPALINALFDLHMSYMLNNDLTVHEPGTADLIHEPTP